jgi:hypothetical protein
MCEKKPETAAAPKCVKNVKRTSINIAIKALELAREMHEVAGLNALLSGDVEGMIYCAGEVAAIHVALVDLKL